MRDQVVFTSGGEAGPSEPPSTPPRAPVSARAASKDTPGLPPGVRRLHEVENELRDRVKKLNRGHILTESHIKQIANSLWYATDDTSIAVAITNISDKLDALTDQKELVDVLRDLEAAWADHMNLEKNSVRVTLETDPKNKNYLKVTFTKPFDDFFTNFPEYETDQSKLQEHIEAFDAKMTLEGAPKVSMVILPTNNLTIPLSDFLEELAKRLDPEEATDVPGGHRGKASSVRYYKLGIIVANNLFGRQMTEKITDAQIREEINEIPNLNSTAKQIILNWVKKIHQKNLRKD